jgi:hypothetical protein
VPQCSPADHSKRHRPRSCGESLARRCHHSDRAKRQRRETTGARRVACASIPGNYGPGAGAKPDGVVAVTVGLATLISGAGGGVVVVTVCPVACGVTGPTTRSGAAELTSPKITPSAPMATTALTPIVADPNFH